MPSPGARPRHRAIASLIFAVLLVGLVLWAIYARLDEHARESSLTECAFTGSTMGTTYHVKVVFGPAAIPYDRQSELQDRIAKTLDAVDGTMSTYDPQTELSRFNEYRSTEAVPMSDGTLAVMAIAQQVSESSGGAFDITVGPLVNAYGFGPYERQGAGPSEDELAELKECVGYQHLHIDRQAGTVRKARQDVYCDLSAIAKGYAVDKVSRAIVALGYEDFMVEVGGEVRASGRNKDRVPWRIGIEKPDPEGRTIQEVVPLSGMALATSGDYRNYFEIDGIRMSHTIDPRTGRPVAHTLASASVFHRECAWADACATTIMVLGPQEGYDYAVREGLAALLIIHDKEDTFVERATPALTQLLAAAPKE